MMRAFGTLSVQAAELAIRPSHFPLSRFFERRIPFEYGKAGLLGP